MIILVIMMNPKNFSVNEANKSLPIVWNTMITYLKAILFFGKAMHSRKINNKIIAKSIANSYEYLHMFIKFLIMRYELTEFMHISVVIPEFIEETEKVVNEMYKFSHESVVRLYDIRKISYLQTIILNDLWWLQSISQQNDVENNPNTKWLTCEVFNPTSTVKGGSE